MFGVLLLLKLSVDSQDHQFRYNLCNLLSLTKLPRLFDRWVCAITYLIIPDEYNVCVSMCCVRLTLCFSVFISYLSLSCFVFGICCTLFFFLGTTERRPQHFPLVVQSPVQDASSRKQSSLQSSSFLGHMHQVDDEATIEHWKDWLKSRAFYLIGFQYMTTRMLVNVPQVFITL